MAMVKALLDCFIDNGYRRAGDTFRYEGPEIPDVIEFIASEHTPRNLMIRAIFTGRPATQKDFNELDSIVGQWQLRPHLVALLAEAIAAQRQNALS